MFDLIVTVAFGNHKVGDRIPAKDAADVDPEFAHRYVQVPADEPISAE